MKNKNKKRILSVTIRQMIDDSPDTSMLGEYSNTPKSEYAIDRAHSEDCESLIPDIGERPDLPHEEDCTYRLSGGLSECSCDKDSTPHECDCNGGDMERNQYRYFNPNHDNYAGLPKSDIRKYTRQDYERMESLNRGDWCYLGIQADAEISLPIQANKGCVKGREVFYHTTQHITSGGLWGIESDSDRDYLKSVEQDELADLRSQLKALGFSSRAISTAFKNVERKEK